MTDETDTRVSAAFASVEDRKAWQRLTEVVPAAALFTNELAQRGLNHVYDADHQADVWVASDGAQVAVFVIEGLSLGQAEAVRKRWTEIAADTALSSLVIRRLVSETVAH